MNVSVKKLDQSEAEITVTVPHTELEGFLDNAAQHLSKEFRFDGFRPGKAPRAIVEKRVGKQAVMEEAANISIPKFYTDAVIQEKLETIGTPSISVSKIAPENDFVFTAKVGVMPELKLPEYRKIKITKNEIKENIQETDKALDYLRKSRAKHSEVDRPARQTDRVSVDFVMSMNKVTVEDGEYKDHPINIGDGQIVKGFEEQLVGMKKGDKKEFSLTFPPEHFKKDVAGKAVDFAVTMNKVEEVSLPDLDDAFAKTLGKFESLEELRTKLAGNIKAEEEFKEQERVETELLEKIAEKTEVMIPEIIIQSETDKMINEMRQQVESMGGRFDDYLTSMKKSMEEIRKDLRKQAEARAKTALIIREVAKREEVDVTAEEIKEEINKILLREGDHPDVKKQILSLEFKEYIQAIIRNRKVLEMLIANATK